MTITYNLNPHLNKLSLNIELFTVLLLFFIISLRILILTLEIDYLVFIVIWLKLMIPFLVVFIFLGMLVYMKLRQ